MPSKAGDAQGMVLVSMSEYMDEFVYKCTGTFRDRRDVHREA